MSRKYEDVPTKGSEHLPLDTQVTLQNGEQVIRKQGRKTLGQSLVELYYEYCGNTSLHGIQYLGQKRPWKEIFFWICIFILSTFYCMQTIGKIYDKWVDTPVIVSFSERSTPIADIPFPAITLCSETRRPIDPEAVQYGHLLALIEKGENLPTNLTENEREEFLTLLHTCNYETLIEKIPRLSNQSLDYIRILRNMSMDMSWQISYCKWFGASDTCDDLLTESFTEDGLCYTFNAFNGTDLFREDTVQYRIMGLESQVKVSSTNRINRTLTWSLEKGYPKYTPLKTYPARVVSANTRVSFDVYLLMATDFFDYTCSGATQGYKIALHTPDDVPLLSKRFVRVSPGKEVSIAIKPVMVTTSDGIASYPAAKRKCFLNQERYLRFFKVYSERNCEMECLTNYTLKDCGCVTFAMPRTADMPVCGEDKNTCYLKAEDNMLQEHFSSQYENGNNCNCLPSCTSLEFDAEISQGDFDTKRYFEASKMDLPFDAAISHLVVHFKDNEFITSKRSELYGFSDFLANCGGVLGLFMGFSILSFVEIIYHATLRLWSNMRSRKNVQ
ncbi:pickpocket protein 28 [Stomoxys calcitrans]|uniref:pickpocket protein 28 n=1 Tax=Stomoxys calcitrans TaxID=35570 RepID=UPI0027E249FB|nr:pickpocket protein 28 [Stomoxys calcitrans]XP_059219968.1 pickpocket protein 28 [Stomoxys calcitrans]